MSIHDALLLLRSCSKCRFDHLTLGQILLSDKFIWVEMLIFGQMFIFGQILFTAKFNIRPNFIVQFFRTNLPFGTIFSSKFNFRTIFSTPFKCEMQISISLTLILNRIRFLLADSFFFKKKWFINFCCFKEFKNWVWSYQQTGRPRILHKSRFHLCHFWKFCTSN